MIISLWVVAIVLILAYSLLLLRIASDWKNTESVDSTPIITFPTVSMIIAARNEATSIDLLIDSIISSEYPLEQIEIIVVDDYSTDETPEIVDRYQSDQVKLLSLGDVTDHGSKKQAIAYAASQASGDIWLFTDADCIVSPQWITRCVQAFQSDEELNVVLGPITYPYSRSLIVQWQQLDLMGMMAVTKSGIDRRQWFIANGANLAITKELWDEVGYPLDHPHTYASGDDVTLVQKAAEIDPYSIKYLLDPDYIVTTQAQPSFSDLMKQRLRWTSKNAIQSGLPQKVVMGLTWVFSIVTVLAILISITIPGIGYIAITLLFAKALIDTIYLSRIQQFYKSEISPLTMLVLSPLHTIYVAVFGLLALFPQRYHWKGRVVK